MEKIATLFLENLFITGNELQIIIALYIYNKRNYNIIIPYNSLKEIQGISRLCEKDFQSGIKNLLEMGIIRELCLKDFPEMENTKDVDKIEALWKTQSKCKNLPHKTHLIIEQPKTHPIIELSNLPNSYIYSCVKSTKLDTVAVPLESITVLLESPTVVKEKNVTPTVIDSNSKGNRGYHNIEDLSIPQNQFPAHVRGQRKKEYSAEFEEFWIIYPRKKEKMAAYKKYCACLKKGYTPQQLLLAAEKYAAQCEQMGTDQVYIKHPATFLGPSEPFQDYLIPEPEISVAPKENKNPPAPENSTKKGNVIFLSKKDLAEERRIRILEQARKEADLLLGRIGQSQDGDTNYEYDE